MTEKLVTVATFSDYIEAEMARQCLADHGIKAVVTGANASNLYPISAIARPELQVLEGQAPRSRELLASNPKDQEA